MGLVFRNGRPYFYESEREGGRVTSKYRASGQDALLIAALVTDDREWKQFDRARERSERRELDDLEQALDEMAERARDLARDALSARRDIISIIGANGGSAVSQDIVKARFNDRMMDNWAVGKLIDWAAGKGDNEQTKARLREELTGLVAEFAGPNPSPVEWVLAETAATSWFAFRMHEAHYVVGVTSEGGITLAQSEHAQRRMDRCTADS